MVDERSIVALLYRADWRRLSLSGVVRGGRQPMLSVMIEELRPRPGRSFPPPPPFGPPSGPPGETDMTLLVAPGGRYRVTSQEGHVWGCDGERGWAWLGEVPEGKEIHLGGDPEPPFPELLEPSWLLAGYDLTVEGDTTACGRPAIRVVATARMAGRERHEKSGPPGRWLHLYQADSAVAVVDAEFGILLRCETQGGERPPDVAEFRSLTMDPESGPAQFTAPPGSVFTAERAPWPSLFPFGGVGREVAKTAAGLAAAGLGATIKYRPRRRPDPFARATEEAVDPDAAMPPDVGAAPDQSAGSAAPPVSDDLLHLLYRSGADEPRFTATLHNWIDLGALLEAVPESARKTGFGGVGFLVDAIRDAADDPGIHLVSSVRIGGWDRYRIDATYPPAGESSALRGWHPHRPSPLTEACDGQRRWQVFADRVEVGDAAPLPEEIARLADGSWLLGGQLSGGEEITVGGRRAYRAGRSRYRTPFPLLRVLSMDSFPAVAAVDAESGRLLRVTKYVGGKAVSCSELRDIMPDTSGDFGFEPPAGLRVVEEEPPAEQPPNPAEVAMGAVRGFLGTLRRGER